LTSKRQERESERGGERDSWLAVSNRVKPWNERSGLSHLLLQRNGHGQPRHIKLLFPTPSTAYTSLSAKPMNPPVCRRFTRSTDGSAWRLDVDEHLDVAVTVGAPMGEVMGSTARWVCWTGTPHTWRPCYPQQQAPVPLLAHSHPGSHGAVAQQLASLRPSRCPMAAVMAAWRHLPMAAGKAERGSRPTVIQSPPLAVAV